MKSLKSKVVVITGATRGLGAAFALTLARAGCQLILCGRRENDLATIAERVVSFGGGRPDLVQLDLADVSSVSRAVNQIVALNTGIDILINNGAMWLENSQTPYKAEDVLSVVNAAITGTFLIIQGLKTAMQKSSAPDILTIGSISGLPNAALQSVSVPFYAAKRGQIALADGLRQEFINTKFRSILINPPYLDDAMPDESNWAAASNREQGQRTATSDVVEATIFALTRPRHISLNLEIGADEGGQYTCELCQHFMKSHCLKNSMSRRGNCHDNAVV